MMVNHEAIEDTQIFQDFPHILAATNDIDIILLKLHLTSNHKLTLSMIELLE